MTAKDTPSSPGRGGVPAAASGEILARLERLYPEKIDLHLHRVERLLNALGRPQDRLKGVIHVAGTNGKGSVIAFLKAILEAAGRRVHTFTSPHLVRFHERISLARPGGACAIAEPELVELLLRVEAANGDEPITFFEIITAAAFLAYAEDPADYVILETGLGGRLDATNVVAKPALTVIMPVSFDHAHYLGDTLAKIAGEKAGILKAGVACVIAHQETEALAAIEARAAELDAPLLAAGREWDAFEQHGRLVFQTGSALLDLPLPRLQGRHQIGNAGAAVAAAHALLGGAADESALAAGLAGADWPARMQLLTAGPLNTLAAEGTEIWLDGGHNPAAATVLAQSMADLEERAARPLHLICGMMGTKDAAGFFAPFQGLARKVLTVDVPGKENCHPAGALAAAARAAGLEAQEAAGVEEAVTLSRAEPDQPVRILICGSLYLAGEVLARQDAAQAV